MPENIDRSNNQPLHLIVNNNGHRHQAKPRLMVDDVIDARPLYRSKDSFKIRDFINCLVEYQYPVERENADWLNVGKFRLNLKKGTIIVGAGNTHRTRGLDAFYHLISAYRNGVRACHRRIWPIFE